MDTFLKKENYRGIDYYKIQFFKTIFPL